jgi:hypothetical protein
LPAQVKPVPIVASAIAAACITVGVLSTGAAAAPVASSTPVAKIDKVGWWNVSRGPQPGEPDTPLRPALAPVPAPPTNVPADAVGVGAGAGEPTKAAAVGIVLEGAPGGTVDALTLTLEESTAPGANVGTDGAAIVACPITGFWGETRNGNWVDRPTADCNLAEAPGTRAADGTWTFDLAQLASAAGWLDPGSSIGQNGVLLVEKVDAPAGFEASFPDPAAGGMQLRFAASGGAGADPFATGADSFALGGAGDAAPAGGDLGGADPFRLSPAPVPSATSSTPAPAAAAAPTAPAARATTARPPAAARSTSRAGDLVGNLSPATYLLIPAALIAALGLSLHAGGSLGPAGAAPTPIAASGTRRRQVGGLSRALARRERADLASPR